MIPNTSPAHLSKDSVAVSNIKENPLLLQKAMALAKSLQLNHVSLSKTSKYSALLIYTENGLQIQLKQDMDSKSPATLRIDFLSDTLAYRRLHGGGIKQALARAVGIKSGIRPSILDATAGLGKDSFLLASLGCQVTMTERSPLLAALLQDALARASNNPNLQQAVLNKLTLVQGEAVQIIANLEKQPDTIYLDPMYPHKRKSALNKQEMRIIRLLVGDDDDAGIVLDSALLCAGKRVVVKRPKGASLINEKQPSHVIAMKNSRYDVYMV